MELPGQFHQKCRISNLLEPTVAVADTTHRGPQRLWKVILDLNPAACFCCSLKLPAGMERDVSGPYGQASISTLVKTSLLCKPRASGLFFFSPSQILSFFFSNVISNSTKPSMVLTRRSLLLIVSISQRAPYCLLFLLFPFGNLLVPARYESTQLCRKVFGSFDLLHRKRLESRALCLSEHTGQPLATCHAASPERECSPSPGMHFHVFVSKSLLPKISSFWRSIPVFPCGYFCLVSRLLESLGTGWQTLEQMARSWPETSNPLGGVLWDFYVSQLLEKNIHMLITRSNVGTHTRAHAHTLPTMAQFIWSWWLWGWPPFGHLSETQKRNFPFS